MSERMFKKDAQQLIFYKKAGKKTFFKLSQDGYEKTSASVDLRKTMIPVKVAGKGYKPDIRIYSTTHPYYWLYPDGTTEATDSPNYILKDEIETIYFVMPDGVNYIHRFIYGNVSGILTNNCSVMASDLLYVKTVSLFWAQGIQIIGTMKEFALFMNNQTNEFYINGGTNTQGLTGSFNECNPVNLTGRVLFYSLWALSGSVDFVSPARATTISFSNCYSINEEDISTTILNLDIATPVPKARSFYCNTVKRSELTAAAEAAVVSLIAKSCTFTFEAE